MKCPSCGTTTKQNKNGFTKGQSQRYRCQHCQKSYTPQQKPRGYPKSLRQKALQMYVDGINFRRIGRFLGVHHQSVINWVNFYADQVPDALAPEQIDDVETDELFTFISSKKTKST